MAASRDAALAATEAVDRGPWIPLATGTPPRNDPRAASPGRVVGRFVAANLLAVLLLLAGGAWASARAAENEALADARRTTDLLAEIFVETTVDQALLDGEAGALAVFDAMSRTRLEPIDVVRLKIWTPDGRIVYSDEPRLIGARYPLEEGDREALRDGVTRAEVSDLSRPENRFERSSGRLLEVYRQVEGPGGQPLLLETYTDYERATARRWEIWWEFTPISVAVVLLLVAVQAPLAYRMVRQLRASQEERELLQARALDASTEERRRIAGSLHDGIVQDVSASALLVGRAAEELREDPAGPSPRVGDVLGQAATALRESVGSLRALLVEIYPPSLERSGLPLALADVADRLRPRGIDVRVRVDENLDLSPECAALVLRTAQEALRNVVKHARARHVDLSLTGAGDRALLEVTDDGVGFDARSVLDQGGTGHLGLRLLADQAATEGASLSVRTAPGRGTGLRLEVSTR